MGRRITHNFMRPGMVLLLLGSIALASLLQACGGSTETATQVPAQGAVNGTSSDESLFGVGPDGAQIAADRTISYAGAASQIENLDHDAIVAAHEQVMIQIYQDLLPSMVQIRVTQRLQNVRDLPSLPGHPDLPQGSLPDDFFRQGEGSGFVWDQEGHLVTNNHVVEGAERVTLVFADREELEAKVIGADPDSDLAVLEIQGNKDRIRPVVLGDSDALQVGQMAIAIGNPFGQQFTMTSGIVSALGRTISSSGSPFSIPEVIQTDAAMNPGNSGGPVLDRQGRVIGVSTQIASLSGYSSGVGFSVPINMVKKIIPALIEDGHYDYSWLGVSASTLPQDTAERMDMPRNTGGALIIRVSADSPAENAGLRGSDSTFNLEGVEFSLGGDIVVGINGSPVKVMDDMVAYLVSETRPGDKVQLDVIRDGGERITLEITLGQRPSDDR